MYACVTRFTDETWEQNQRFWDNKGNIIVYNSPTRLSDKIPFRSTIIIFEMNNSINKIMGISYLINNDMKTRKYKIYDNDDYNRYSYIAKCRIDAQNMNEDELNIMTFFEHIFFKGRAHFKKGRGINLINDKKLFDKCKHILDLKEFLLLMFKKRSLL